MKLDFAFLQLSKKLSEMELDSKDKNITEKKERKLIMELNRFRESREIQLQTMTVFVEILRTANFLKNRISSRLVAQWLARLPHN